MSAAPRVFVWDVNGESVVRSGKNLRVIQDYGRKVKGVHALAQDGYWLRVEYANGAYSTVAFADRDVLRKWIADRVRIRPDRWKNETGKP